MRRSSAASAIAAWVSRAFLSAACRPVERGDRAQFVAGVELGQSLGPLGGRGDVGDVVARNTAMAAGVGPILLRQLRDEALFGVTS